MTGEGVEQTPPVILQKKPPPFQSDLWGTSMVHNEGASWIEMIEEELEHVPLDEKYISQKTTMNIILGRCPNGNCLAQILVGMF